MGNRGLNSTRSMLGIFLVLLGTLFFIQNSLDLDIDMHYMILGVLSLCLGGAVLIKKRTQTDLITVIVGIAGLLYGAGLITLSFNALDYSWTEYIPDFGVASIYFLIGLLIFATSSNRIAGLVVILFGILMMKWALWPLALVALGLYLVFRKSAHHNHFQNAEFTDTKFHTNVNSTDAEDKLEEVSIFGGTNRNFLTSNFKGGSITAIFGGSEIDLSQCKLSEGEHVLEVTAIFGGTNLRMPSDWRIDIDVVPIFGGFSDRRLKDPNIVYPDDRRLIIKGMTLFGGGDIKN